MLKTIAVAFAPIASLAANRGAGTGLDADNAVEIVLIPGTLSLYTYNSYWDFQDELHGDLVWTVSKPANAASVPAADMYYQYTEFGVCVSMRENDAIANTTHWECCVVRGDVDKTPAGTDA